MTVIKGTITDATGQPLAGATITFTALQNTVGMLRSVATYITTVRGEYEFTVTPGVYSVSLAQNGTNGYALGGCPHIRRFSRRDAEQLPEREEYRHTSRSVKAV